MRYALLLVVLSSYFVEWIPNNVTAAAASSQQSPAASAGEWPWQG